MGLQAPRTLRTSALVDDIGWLPRLETIAGRAVWVYEARPRPFTETEFQFQIAIAKAFFNKDYCRPVASPLTSSSELCLRAETISNVRLSSGAVILAAQSLDLPMHRLSLGSAQCLIAARCVWPVLPTIPGKKRNSQVCGHPCCDHAPTHLIRIDGAARGGLRLHRGMLGAHGKKDMHVCDEHVNIFYRAYSKSPVNFLEILRVVKFNG